MGTDMEDGDTYICSYDTCYIEIDPVKMQEGRDFGVMVSRDSVEWRLSDNQPYGLFFPAIRNRGDDVESDECPVKMDGYLLCKATQESFFTCVAAAAAAGWTRYHDPAIGGVDLR